jgi:diguanylate cyclase (GGDEF)-like protein
VNTATRARGRRREARVADAADAKADFSGPALNILLGLALAGRSLLSGGGPLLKAYGIPLLAARILLSLAMSVWGAVRLAQTVKPRSSRIFAWISGDGRSSILLAWSTALSVADLFAGSGPAVFIAGVAYAAAIGWDRLKRFVLLALGCFLCVAIAALASGYFSSGSLELESLLAAAAASGAAIYVARAVRSFVAPGREKLRSLERENKQLWDLSFRDALTGLYNRRFAQETGRILLSRAKRYQEQLHVFMIDIDHFKRVNDEISHAIGDDVLKSVAEAIHSCLRTSDSVSRYGGEEFLAYVVQAEAEVAQFIANRIREAVAFRKYDSVPWQVTISIGVASAQGDDDLESLVDRADKYLYSSKRGGRNRVTGF